MLKKLGDVEFRGKMRQKGIQAEQQQLQSKHGCGMMGKDSLVKIIQLKDIKGGKICVEQRILLAGS